jgi:cytochrome c biogenesis protein CcdA
VERAFQVGPKANRYNQEEELKPMSSLPLPLAAFFAGLISFLSPCVLPLVPGYLSLISGVGIEELKSPQAQLMRRVMVNSIGFILGFSVVFIALGAAATEVGQVLGVGKSGGRGHHSLRTAPDRHLQDQGAVYGRPVA